MNAALATVYAVLEWGKLLKLESANALLSSFSAHRLIGELVGFLL